MGEAVTCLYITIQKEHTFLYYWLYSLKQTIHIIMALLGQTYFYALKKSKKSKKKNVHLREMVKKWFQMV